MLNRNAVYRRTPPPAEVDNRTHRALSRFPRRAAVDCPQIRPAAAAGPHDPRRFSGLMPRSDAVVRSPALPMQAIALSNIPTALKIKTRDCHCLINPQADRHCKRSGNEAPRAVTSALLCAVARWLRIRSQTVAVQVTYSLGPPAQRFDLSANPPTIARVAIPPSTTLITGQPGPRPSRFHLRQIKLMKIF